MLLLRVPSRRAEVGSEGVNRLGKQIRPGGLAAFPVDVTVTSEGMAVEEEGLTIMAEVTRGAKPSQQDIDELISFIRTTVYIRPAQCMARPPKC